MEVLVLATMSAGKSTFINALIGQELLHSANEATTACLTSVRHESDLTCFYGSSYSVTNKILSSQDQLQAETVRDWNNDPEVTRISLTGSFKANPNLESGLVLHDTPGPNNSQDDRHAEQMLNALRTISFDLVCYVLNATQLGTNDDRNLLIQLQGELKEKSRLPIYFILNKVDQLDAEKGERISETIADVSQYLTELGFDKPIIIPTMSNIALSAHKAINKETLTRLQRHVLRQALEHIDERELEQVDASFLPDATQLKLVKNLWLLAAKQRKDCFSDEELESNKLQRLIAISGLKAVEYLIDAQRELLKEKNNTPNIIEITHNPFTIKTTFIINGQVLAENCSLMSYTEIRLQKWVDLLFDELGELFDGNNNYQITFKGVESDYLDVEYAVEAAREKNMNIELLWIPSRSSEERMEQILELLEEHYANPNFNYFLEKNEKIAQLLKEVLNKEFETYVVAGMSSGKSTLINAMLCSDLLPVANQATAASITRITDNSSMDGLFSAKRFDVGGTLVDQKNNISVDVLKEWSSLSNTRLVDIEGGFQNTQKHYHARLVLIDTPEPNNSHDEDYNLIIKNVIQDSKHNPLILYVLNATHLGAIDDRNLLGLVAEIMRKRGKQSKERFVFVVNKMDMFDPEAGDDIAATLERVKAYLEQNGISNPKIYPVSANFTRLMRKYSEEYTRKERNDYKVLADLFSEEPSMNMLQYMPITSRVHRSLEAKKYSSLMLASGMPAVEAMVDEYIDKYDLPYRMNEIYKIFNKLEIDIKYKEYDLLKNKINNHKNLIEEMVLLLKLKMNNKFIEELNKKIDTIFSI